MIASEARPLIFAEAFASAFFMEPNRPEIRPQVSQECDILISC